MSPFSKPLRPLTWPVFASQCSLSSHTDFPPRGSIHGPNLGFSAPFQRVLPRLGMNPINTSLENQYASRTENGLGEVPMARMKGRNWALQAAAKAPTSSGSLLLAFLLVFFTKFRLGWLRTAGTSTSSTEGFSWGSYRASHAWLPSALQFALP